MTYTPPSGNAVSFNFSGAYTPPNGSAVNFAFSELTVRALVLINGQLSQVPIGYEGVYRPLILVNGMIKQRAVLGTETPLIIDTGTIRQAHSNETVIV